MLHFTLTAKVLREEYIYNCEYKKRENRRDNQELTIKRFWQHWTHTTQDEDKQNKNTQKKTTKTHTNKTKTKHTTAQQSLKKMSNTGVNPGTLGG